MDRSSVLEQIEALVSGGNYEAAMKLSQNLRTLSLEGLHYFHTYDWLMLMSVITLGYIGWMICLVLHELQSYTSFSGSINQMIQLRNYRSKVYICGFLVMAATFGLLFVEHSPPLYHMYTAMTIFLWTQIFSEYQFLKLLWKDLSSSNFIFSMKLLATSAVAVVILEFLVYSFADRKLYTYCFLIVGVLAAIYFFYVVPGRSAVPIFVLISCWFLSSFTLMPAEIPDNTPLVQVSC